MSLFSSLNIESMAGKAAAHPASLPAHIYRDPTDEIASSFDGETTTFLIILLKISPTPPSLKPEFLSRGISRHASKTSLLVRVNYFVHIF